MRSLHDPTESFVFDDKGEAEKTGLDLSSTFGYLAAGAVGAALGAGACYMIAKNKEENKERERKS